MTLSKPRQPDVGAKAEALTAAEQAVEISRRLAPSNPAACEPHVAGSLSNLGARMSDVGQRESGSPCGAGRSSAHPSTPA
jgi:hypothetical protein